MITLNLTISLPKGGKKCWQFTGPSSWDELSEVQAVAAMRFRALVSRKPEAVFPLLKLLYNMQPEHLQWVFDERFLRRKGIDAPLRSQALQFGQALIDTIRWTGETEPGPAFLVAAFDRFSHCYGTLRVLINRSRPLPRYYAPGVALASSTFEEFMWTEKAYHSRQFALLAAILYRPRRSDKSTGDCRTALDKHQLEVRAAEFERLEPALVALIVAQYEACQRELQRCFPRVFPCPPVTEGTPATKPPKSTGNWLDIAINLAGLDLTKIAQIEQVNLYLALKVLDQQIQQADELEKQLEKIRK